MASIQSFRRTESYVQGIRGSSGIAAISLMWAGMTFYFYLLKSRKLCFASFIITAIFTVCAIVRYGFELYFAETFDIAKLFLITLPLVLISLLLLHLWKTNLLLKASWPE